MLGNNPINHIYSSFNKEVATANESSLIPKDFNVFPNPASNELTINSDGVEFSSDVVIKLFDVTGKLYISERFQHAKNPYTLSVAYMPVGL